MSTQLDETKKVVRSLLIAVKSDGIPLRLLERMYEDIEGKKIPLHGHVNMLTLLNSLSDTVYTVIVGHHFFEMFFFSFRTQ